MKMRFSVYLAKYTKHISALFSAKMTGAEAKRTGRSILSCWIDAEVIVQFKGFKQFGKRALKRE